MVASGGERNLAGDPGPFAVGWKKVAWATAVLAGTVLWTLLAVAEPASAQGSFATPQYFDADLGNDSGEMARADFDGDGKMDLAATRWDQGESGIGPHQVAIMPGNGDGTFGTATYYDLEEFPAAITAGDFDDDGDEDLATANDDADSVSVLLNNGAGTFAAPASYSVGSEPAAIESADLDGDGNEDLTTASRGRLFTDGYVSVLLAQGDGTFGAPTDYQGTDMSMLTGVTVADFDSDGVPDVAAPDADEDSVWLLSGVGDGTFRRPIAYGTGDRPTEITSGDFDADGHTDVATANMDSDDVSILLNPMGNGIFNVGASLGLPEHAMALTSADFDGDGYAEPAAVVADGLSNSMVYVWWGGDGGSFGGPSAYELSIDEEIMVAENMIAGDFKGHGYPDIIASASSVAVLLNTSPEPVLNVSMYDEPDPATVGEELTYTVRLSNAGPNTATGVTVTDPIPASASFVSASYTNGQETGECAEDSGEVRCEVGSLTVGARAMVEITVRPTADAAPRLSNTVTVTSDQSGQPGAKTATQTTPVRPSADLSLQMDAAPDPVYAGQDLTYTLTATNDGPSDATGVVVTDELPEMLALGSATFENGATSGECAQDGNTVTCEVGALEALSIATVTLEVEPEAGTVPEVTNTATVDGAQYDPDPSDDTATRTTAVNADADLSLQMSAAPGTVFAGQDVTYTMDVQNLGPDDATSVAVTDELPDALEFESADFENGSQAGSCEEEGGVVTCEIGGLDADASATVTVEAEAQGAAVPEVENTASVDGAQFDPNEANNATTATVEVDPSANITLRGKAPEQVRQGATFSYTLAVLNRGPNDAEGVSVRIGVPAGLNVLMKGTDDRCRYVAGSANTIECDLGKLEADAGKTVLTVKAQARTEGKKKVAAVVRSETHDPSGTPRTSMVMKVLSGR